MKTVAFLTDFQEKDGFVGIMKGVILSINPNVNFVDISNNIPPQDIDSARFVLFNSYRYFPVNTVFVVVVDPGVGTKREILCMKTAEHLFISPDNGVLDWVIEREFPAKIYYIIPEKIALANISSTFHGRDIFAPAAARLTLGHEPERFSKPVKDYTPSPFPIFEKKKNGEIQGKTGL